MSHSFLKDLGNNVSTLRLHKTFCLNILPELQLKPIGIFFDLEDKI
jgi:hypothetical protein